MLSFLGNLIWLLFGGFVTSLGYILGGLTLCVTVVGIPFGIQSIKIGIANLTPFGTEIVELEDANNLLRTIFNVIWIVLFGWGIAIAHVIHGLILFVTIIGIPFAQQHFKMTYISLFPFGRELR